MTLEEHQVIYYASCDECSCEEEVYVEPDSDFSYCKAEAAESLRDSNWKVEDEDGEILCPDCNPDYVEVCSCCGKPAETHKPVKKIIDQLVS
jgi:hypothetical protein